MWRSRLTASHLAGGPGLRLYSAAEDVGPSAAAARGFRSPCYLRLRSAPDPRPQTPKCFTLSPSRLTVRSRQTESGMTGKRRVRHSCPRSGIHAPRRRWRRSPEGLQFPWKGKPGPRQGANMYQRVRAPPASASPPPSWAVLPRSRGELWVSQKLAQLQGKEVVASQPKYEVRQKLQFPAGSGAADGSRGDQAENLCARGEDGTLLELAGLATEGWSRKTWTAARQSRNPGGGQLCN